MRRVLFSALLVALGTSPALARRAPTGLLDFSPQTTVLPANGVFFVLVGEATVEPSSVTYTSSTLGNGTLTSTERYGGLIIYDLPEGPGRLSITVDGPDGTIATIVELSAEHDDVPPGVPWEVAGNWRFPSEDTTAVVVFAGNDPVAVRTRDSIWSSPASPTGASCGYARAIDVAGQLGMSSVVTCSERPSEGCTSTGAATPGVLLPALVLWGVRRWRRRDSGVSTP